ncbi:MAG TPA: hypothetical protein VFV80_13010 [Geminicoccaceae bacterium]|nr:hypothetical protein [Geminicoccaceae bacterium]
MLGWLAELRETSASRWPARESPRGYRMPGGLRLALLALFSVGGAVGLWLWGKWGFLIAFDAIRTYCF